jgi:hypothetical protein
MIDTIHIYSKSYSILEKFDIGAIENLTEHNGKYGKYFNGNIGNFRVSYSKTNLSLKGSLTKFLLGNNVQNMNRNQITESFKKLEERLGFFIGDLRITRIDLGVTFEMKSVVANYLDSLIEIAKYDVSTYGCETKSFINKSKTITFYDKFAEFKKDRSSTKLTDLGINSANLLRYELQINKANRVLGKVTVNELNDDSYLMKLVNLWKNTFHKIKMNRKLIDVELIKIEKPKDFNTYLVCDRIEEKGKGESFQLLNRLCMNGTIDRRRKYDLKKRIEANEKKFCITSKYIDELETLIDQYTEEFL